MARLLRFPVGLIRAPLIDWPAAARRVLAIGIATLLFFSATNCDAFSVLAHQAVVDQAWDGTLLPLLRKRYPNATSQDLEDARAYARGGSHLPDLGYFPFGSRLFTDLLHYVRTGDFYERALKEAGSVREYAFALGLLAHYEADSVGHPEGTNIAVPIIYPDLAQKYGNVVSYVDSPSAHLETEFRFDVLQVAHRHQIPYLFENSIQFKVPREFLERIFQETYGVKLDDLFVNYDVALTTYRWGFRTLLDEGTGIAWALYKPEIESEEPGIKKKQFVQSMSRNDFVHQFGRAFLEPGYFARTLSFLANLVPNVGPLKRLPYKPLPKDVQQMYFHAYRNACAQYLREVSFVSRDEIFLPNLILDTGQPPIPGAYEPADHAYAELLDLHAKDRFAHLPTALAGDMLNHFSDRNAALAFEKSDTQRRKTTAEVDALARAIAASRPTPARNAHAGGRPAHAGPTPTAAGAG